MAINEESERKEIFLGSGSTGPFPCDFPITDESEIVVTKIVDDVSNVLTITDEYTVTLVALGTDGFEVTLTAALASGETLVIVGNTPLTQQADFSNSDSFDPEAHEAAFDKGIKIGQENRRLLKAALRAPVEEDLAKSDLELPPASVRANKYLTFDADGLPDVADLVVTGTPVSDFMAGVLAAADVFAARAALAVQANAINLCPNPRFTFPLAATPAAPADNDYIFQGWRVLMESANAVVPSFINASSLALTDSDGQSLFINDRLRLTVGSANNNKFGIFCVIENDTWDLMRNMVASLQAAAVRNGSGGINDLRMAVLYWTGVGNATTADPISSWNAAGTNPTLAANWNYANTPTALVPTATAQRFKIENITIPSASTNGAIFIWSDDKSTTSTTDWIEISNVMPERGTKCGEFSMPPMATQLQQNQRFYQSVAGNTQAIGAGQCITTTTARITVPLRTTMRSVPTLAISSAAHFSVTQADGTLVACTGVSLNSASTADVAVLDITVASGLVAGNATRLVTNSASATLEFKAQL